MPFLNSLSILCQVYTDCGYRRKCSVTNKQFMQYLQQFLLPHLKYDCGPICE